VDVVYHLAGLVSFWRKHKELLHRVNVAGTRHVLQEAARANVPRVVHVSSVAAVGYNDRHDQPIDENFAFDWSSVRHKHYMTSKRLAEQEVMVAGKGGLNCVIANPGLMWGPGDVVNSAKLISALHRRKVPVCPPGGTNIADVRDVAHGLVSLLNQGRPGERYILGGHNLTFREAYDVIAAQLGIRPPARTVPRALRGPLYYAALVNELLRSEPPAFTSDIVESAFMFRYFSSAKAERELGWKLHHGFPETIQHSIDWLKANGKLV
jgi:dihydroflavonol-4-reductase